MIENHDQPHEPVHVHYFDPDPELEEELFPRLEEDLGSAVVITAIRDEEVTPSDC